MTNTSNILRDGYKITDLKNGDKVRCVSDGKIYEVKGAENDWRYTELGRLLDNAHLLEKFEDTNYDFSDIEEMFEL